MSDNPFAFPFNEMNDDGSHYFSNAGMALRDWFAGQALAGSMVGSFSSDYLSEDAADGIAREAYLVADAMLRERGKP